MFFKGKFNNFTHQRFAGAHSGWQSRLVNLHHSCFTSVAIIIHEHNVGFIKITYLLLIETVLGNMDL